MSDTAPTSGTDVLSSCVIALVTLAIKSWFLMLLLGALHGMYASVPAVGYGTAVLLVGGLAMVTTTIRRVVFR
ncbi:hypothetical protein OG709_29945 [Streptomyces sp. NBC_01267]|uniref:hypothetical protein n=1 Tax=Streptomyces sp. NBC_01267 TaxID=2903805 RepID=UPI002E31E1D3|nr:hypothetical protein [Streptomyces sp. NBC_01267]